MSDDPPAATARLPGHVLGPLLMVGAIACFTILDSLLKYLAATHSPILLAWGRNLAQAVYLLALLPWIGRTRMLSMRRPGVHAARGALLLATTIFIVFALKYLPMAQTYAITFSTPLIATIVAFLALGERVSTTRLAIILVGFAGVVLALGPGSPEASLALLWPIAMACANGSLHVLTRYAGRDEDPMALLFYMGLFACLFATPALPFVWSSLAWWEWGMVALGGVFGTLAHFLLIEAFRRAPTALVSPMMYSQIVFAILLGFVVFGEVPTVMTLIGAAIVAASGIALLRLKS